MYTIIFKIHSSMDHEKLDMDFGPDKLRHWFIVAHMPT